VGIQDCRIDRLTVFPQDCLGYWREIKWKVTRIPRFILTCDIKAVYKSKYCRETNIWEKDKEKKQTERDQLLLSVMDTTEHEEK